jgi:hypothetical protein
MQTQCNPKHLHFQGLGDKKVVAAFDGGTITSDAGTLLLREVEIANRFIERFSQCFVDTRNLRYLEHSVKELVAQRAVGLCLGYEDTNDHDELRRDPLLATVCLLCRIRHNPHYAERRIMPNHCVLSARVREPLTLEG